MEQFEEKIPSHIDRYVIEGLFAKGGMGKLFLAEDPTTHQEVLIKVLCQKFLNNPSIVQQFLNEAKIMKTANHPNIVKLYDFGKWEEGVFIAMELVNGKSLLETLRECPLPLKNALQVVLQIASSVLHLHTHGIIHGDLKLENILLTDKGEVKILDFGIASLAKESQKALETFQGTPIYMSPETQSDPHSRSIQSDVFSLGIIAYELVLGKIAHGRAVLTLAPKGMQPILQKALHPNPQLRYETVSDFMKDISSYLEKKELEQDRQGTDFFFDLFHELRETVQACNKRQLEFKPSRFGITYSSNIRHHHFFFQQLIRPDEYAIVIGETTKEGVQGVEGLFSLHTLFELKKKDNSSLPFENMLDTLFQEIDALKLSFPHLVLSLNLKKKTFICKRYGWGNVLHLSSNEKTSKTLFTSNEATVISGTFSQNDPFLVLGYHPSKEIFLSPEKIVTSFLKKRSFQSLDHETDLIFQKLLLTEKYLKNGHPACLIVFYP